MRVRRPEVVGSQDQTPSMQLHGKRALVSACGVSLGTRSCSLPASQKFNCRVTRGAFHRPSASFAMRVQRFLLFFLPGSHRVAHQRVEASAQLLIQGARLRQWPPKPNVFIIERNRTRHSLFVDKWPLAGSRHVCTSPLERCIGGH